MDDDMPDLSTALCQYLGYENRRWMPRQHADVVRIYGEEHAAALRTQVAGLLREVKATPVDWSRLTMEEGAAALRATLRQQHPELTDDGRDALVSWAAFPWR